MDEKLDIEKAMQRLSEIVERMESGNISLEESMKLFGEGIALSEKSLSVIHDAQQVIESGKTRLEDALHDD